MAQTIRNSVFETNSSSSHSLCIMSEGWDEYCKNCDFENPYNNYHILVESELKPLYGNYKTAIVTTTNYYKRGNGFYLIKGDLHKIQFLLSSMISEGDIFTTDLNSNQLERFQQIYKTINKYLKIKYEIDYLKINKFESDDNGLIINSLIGYEWKESEYSLEEIDNIINKIISDDNIVFICHSDEIGPFPEDIDLIEIINLKELINNENSKK